jgi:hypothetical protein
MRGTPFIKEAFHGGLNSIDSPYTLLETECRDCLNVVSTERGAIKKRTGSTLFSKAGFPKLGVTDKFIKEEKPLSEGGNWKALPIAGNPNTGRVYENAGWSPGAGAQEEELSLGIYWHTEQATNPAASVELRTWGPKASSLAPGFTLLICLQPGEMSGYGVRVSDAHGHGYPIQLIRFTAEKETVLATIDQAFLEGETVGISAQNGVLTAWVNGSPVLRVEDSTYTGGFAGLQGTIKNNRCETLLTNFSLGEIGASLVFNTLVPVNIAGTPYLIAASGTELFSITAAGAVVSIGSGFTAGALWSIVQAPASTAVASEGPVYLMNGVDPPQYWTGAAANTKVKEWTGAATKPKFTDGKILEGQTVLKSKTAKFTDSDIGLTIFFTTEIKRQESSVAEGPEVVVTEAQIELVKSEEEVVVILLEDGTWAKSVENIHFELDREYYEDATSTKHVPNGKYLIFAGNRMWVGGITDDTSALRFCDTAAIGEGGEQSDPSAWPKENLVRFDTSDGAPLTGLGTVGPYVLVFKQRKTWVIHNLDTGENRKIADTIGCVSHRSIAESVLGTFFLTLDSGVYLTDGAKLHEMSYNVKPTIAAINPTKLEQAAGTYWNNHYYLSYASGASLPNNRTLDYDLMLKSWWLHDLAPAQWALFEASAGEFNLYGAATEGVSRCFVPETYTDFGHIYTGENGLSAFWFGPWEPFAYYVFRHRIKAPFLKKRVRAIFFDGSGEIIPLLYKNFRTSGTQVAGAVNNEPQSALTLPIDFSQGESIWANPDEEQKWAGATYNGNTLVWGGEAETNAARIYAPGVGRVWGVGFGNASAEPFEVDSYAYFVQFRKS